MAGPSLRSGFGPPQLVSCYAPRDFRIHGAHSVRPNPERSDGPAFRLRPPASHPVTTRQKSSPQHKSSHHGGMHTMSSCSHFNPTMQVGETSGVRTSIRVSWPLPSHFHPSKCRETVDFNTVHQGTSGHFETSRFRVPSTGPNDQLALLQAFTRAALPFTSCTF